MDQNFVYSVKRSSLGRQPLFCFQPTQLLDTILPDPVEAKKYILRNPVHMPVQHGPCFSHNTLNTIRLEYSDFGINHAEGGWPKDVNIADPEATQRYRRRIEKDDPYINCVMKSAGTMEHYVYQNNAIDMYQTYYLELDQLPKQEQTECRTVNVYRDDPSNNGRPISSICWKPDGGQNFAVTYVLVDIDKNALASVNANIWDVENPNNPISMIVPPCAMLDLQYNSKEPSVMAGALINGQVATFDTREPRVPAILCPPHVAHRDAVRSVSFIASKSGMMLFSGGSDGAVKWWDMRNFSEPTEEMCMHMVKVNEEQSLSKSQGVSVLEYEPTIPTRFMAGTEDGCVMTGNRKGKTIVDKLPGKFDAHLGPVWALHRNPGFLKNFLTVGDWTARVWNEDCKDSAIIWTAPDRHCINDGIWSPTRLSLMLLAKANGTLTVWDLLRRLHEPVLTVQVCDVPLSKVALHEAGALVTCGSRNGNVYLLELSADLAVTGKHDKSQLTAMLEREAKRERILEARLREIRLKQRQAEEASPAASLASQDAITGDADLDLATTEFNAIIKKELTLL